MPIRPDRASTWSSGSTALAAELYWTTNALGKLLWRCAVDRGAVNASPQVSRAHHAGRPVLLVHGLGADGSCFRSLERKLNAAGFSSACVNYSCHRSDVAGCAAALERAAAHLLARTGAETLDVVAHSLGGVLLRWAVTHTGLRDRVALAVTLGSPHRGTPAALLTPSALPGMGTLVRQLRPGLPELPGLADGSQGPTRWVTIAGGRDWVVPPAYAALPASDNVRNLAVRGIGHLHLTRSRECHSIILDELLAGCRNERASMAA